jgi:predicted DNA-binding antitoxin AbrB/MazE fold protein
MTMIHAVYENGVFRPIDPVNLPDRCRVEFEPRVVGSNGTPEAEGAQAAIYAILGERFSSGHTDTAERHNEHQP